SSLGNARSGGFRRGWLRLERQDLRSPFTTGWTSYAPLAVHLPSPGSAESFLTHPEDVFAGLPCSAIPAQRPALRCTVRTDRGSCRVTLPRPSLRLLVFAVLEQCRVHSYGISVGVGASAPPSKYRRLPWEPELP